MYNGMRRAAASAFAASALALLTACGPGGTADKPDAKAGASVTEAPELTRSQAEKALLVDSDLPKGWKRDPDLVIDGTEYAKPEDLLPKAADATCQPLVDIFNTGRIDSDYKANAQAVFAKGDSMINHDVSGYAPDQAKRAIAALTKAIDKCGTFDSKFGGAKAKVTTKTLEVTEAGEETLGYSVSVRYGDMVVDMEYGTVRDGANVTTVSNNWVDGSDRGKEAFAKGLAKAAENLHVAAQA